MTGAEAAASGEGKDRLNHVNQSTSETVSVLSGLALVATTSGHLSLHSSPP